MAKALMIQGTGSGAGKSLITAALCRVFSDMGIRVAPFKAQNMALNSYITLDGGEIGRAQALQAEAARVQPTVDMNPILLKVSGETGSQVIIHGRVHSTMPAREYYRFRKEAWKAVTESFDRLSGEYDLIVMEGAGSPAEINLMDVDIVNIPAARYAKAPVILVGDIERGGVFASLYGTVKLLGRDGRQIRAFVINKFRGDIEILKPGLAMISEKTGKPVIGVLPYLSDIMLPEEDGLSLYRRAETNRPTGEDTIKIVVVRLKYISNFTDFDPFLFEPDAELIYSTNPAEIENADLVILPGTKNTVKDFLFLKEKRLDESIMRAYAKGVEIMGMCGGYQMLGKRISDPHGVESCHEKVESIGLLDIETVFEKSKITCQVEAEFLGDAEKGRHGLRGYEIHMGTSSGEIGLFRVSRLHPKGADREEPGLVLDGSKNGNCWGTYLHGIFENDLFRRGILNHLREQKGLPPMDTAVNYGEVKEKAMDRLAGIIRENLDMECIERMIRL